MLIGIDFDNTIVDYDALFHKVALEQGVITSAVGATKLAVRDHLRAAGKEDVWTEMQGYVYGARMAEAAMYPGVLEFFCWASDKRIDLAIISHKTRHPFLGPKYDLHDAARAWVLASLVSNGSCVVPPGNVYFELTKEEKIKRIVQAGCDVFLDDLPEILLMEGFPPATMRVLFDPERHHSTIDGISTVCSWADFLREVSVQCQIRL